jgi:hypothetical protein
MAIEHADLTGSQLHEPKGADTASDGDVYVADGAGSGDWINLLDEGVQNLNLYTLEQRFDDLATASSIYFRVPYKSSLLAMNAILYGAVDADTTLTITIGGVLFGEDLEIVAAGTGAGQIRTLTTTIVNSIPAGTLVQITSDGAATASVRAEIQLEFEAIE